MIGIKENDYFRAAQAIGTSTPGTVLRHVLPNIMAPMIVIFSVNVGANILSAAALSFLGYGLPPGTPDWGAMLSWEGRKYMEVAPWLALWPGLCLTIVVYSLNMLGDAQGPARSEVARRRGPCGCIGPLHAGRISSQCLRRECGAFVPKCCGS